MYRLFWNIETHLACIREQKQLMLSNGFSQINSFAMGMHSSNSIKALKDSRIKCPKYNMAKGRIADYPPLSFEWIGFILTAI